MRVELWGGPRDGETWIAVHDMPPTLEIPVPRSPEVMDLSMPEQVEGVSMVTYFLMEIVSSQDRLPVFARYRYEGMNL